jgi:ATP-binding cassette subfamily B protein
MSQTKGIPPLLYRRVCAQVRPYGAPLLGILGLELLSIPLALLVPVPLKLAVDSLTGSYYIPLFAQRCLPARWSLDSVQLFFAIVLMIVVGLLQHVVGLASWLMQTRTSERMILDFRSQLFQHVQRLSLSFHDRRGVGDPTYRIQYDAPSLSQIAIRAVIPAITAVLMLAGTLYVTLRLDWQLAMITVVLGPCLFLITRRYSDRVNEEWTELRERDSRAMSVIHEALGALRVVKAFGKESYEHRRFVRQSGRYVRGQMRLAVLQSSFCALVGLTIVIASATGLVLGVRHVRTGLLTVGDLLLVMSYLAKLYDPLGMLSGKMVEIQSALVSVGRAFALLDEAPEVVESSNPKPLTRAAGAVEFEKVTFGYGRQPVLRNLSLGLSPGVHVGILGRTGAGKSTLLSLLTRLHDPASGRVLLDGTDIREYRLADLRNQFSIVLQEPVLFSASIAENIAYTQPHASRAAVIAAARAARAHDFIMALPEGYDTQVGARGMSLSGGERQRISLARAFLKDAPILILDEPTSSVDGETEAGIVEATAALMRGRTTFVVTHRPSMLQNCDLQFELIDGRLIPVEWQGNSILNSEDAAVRSGSAGKPLPAVASLYSKPQYASGD